MIGAAAAFLFHVHDLSFEHVGEVSAAIFLSIVAYSIAYYEVTPKSDQLTKADQLFGATYLVVLGNFLTMIAVNSGLASRWPALVSRRPWLKQLQHFKWIVLALWVLAVILIPLS
jgi:hypothetical protein